MSFDTTSPEWIAHIESVRKRVATLDVANRVPGVDPTKTEFIRGQIQGLLSTLDLPEQLKPIAYESQGIDAL